MPCESRAAINEISKSDYTVRVCAERNENYHQIQFHLRTFFFRFFSKNRQVYINTHLKCRTQLSPKNFLSCLTSWSINAFIDRLSDIGIPSLHSYPLVN